MGHLSSLSDQELDRLLAGKGPSDEGALDELAVFLREAAALLPEPPGSSTADRHLATMLATARELSESAGRDSKPSVSPSRADRKAPRFRTRSKSVCRNSLPGLAGKLALVAVVVLAAFGGTAYAGALPDGVQGAVAAVGDSFGLSLPGADDFDDGDEDVDARTLDDSDDVTVDDQGDDYPDHLATLEDDQGDDDQGANDDDQGDDEQAVDEDDQGDDDQGDQAAFTEDDQGSADEDDQGSANEDDQGSAGEDSDDQGGDDQGASQDGDDQGGGDEGDGDN